MAFVRGGTVQGRRVHRVECTDAAVHSTRTNGFCYFGLCDCFSNGLGQDVGIRLHSMFGSMVAGGRTIRRYIHGEHAGSCRGYAMRISKKNEQGRTQSEGVVANFDLARNIVAVEPAHKYHYPLKFNPILLTPLNKNCLCCLEAVLLVPTILRGALGHVLSLPR